MLQRALPCWRWLIVWLAWRPHRTAATANDRVWLSWWLRWLPRRRAAAKRPAPSGADRRESIRYGINLDTSTRLIAAVEGDMQPVRVRNISAGGISLVLHRGVEPDTILHLQLLNRPQMFLCRVQVRVTYVVEHPSGDWILGGAFTTRLSDAEVRSLLA